ncbi:MAG: hypothetical protein ACYDHH_05965 [Solirubrobacteraceae bacterium]
MIAFANIGADGLYLLFVWLLSAAIGSWVSERKGYGERLGLAFGLLLTAAGLLLVLLLPSRPGSVWRLEGPLPRRRRGPPPPDLDKPPAPELDAG